MKILYFDCFSGISGDMTLGALLDLGLDQERLISQLQGLGLEGWELSYGRSVKNGISAFSVNVRHEEGHEHRHFSDIVSLIDASDGISPKAKDIAKAIFRRVAVAEGRVHGSTPEQVHFHEVGAVDSIIDIVGTAILIDMLAPDKILCSDINDGFGFTQCQHGKIPVPVPAVVEIFADSGLTLHGTDIPSELVTPTGAAIAAELSGSSSPMPSMRVIKTGYGAGSRDLEIPNVLRVVLGEAEEENPRQTITVIETNIDDLSPEILGYTMEKLLEAGAADVFFEHIQMKKNRPAVKMTVLCNRALLKKISDIIFSETTTIGLRIREESRICLNREIKSLETSYGPLKVKEVKTRSGYRLSPEYDDAKLLAEKNGVPLKEIYDAASTLERH